MAVGAYGTVIPVSVDSSMVDISYCYHENLTYDSAGKAKFYKLDESVLTPAERDVENYPDKVVDGMYHLQLPLSVFNKKGFYTVYIKPKEIPVTIADIGTLTAYPNIRGIVLDTKESGITATFRQKMLENNGLAG